MPFPEEPCEGCPRVARGLPPPCLAQVTGHARLCELAAGGHEGYIARLGGDVPAAFPPLGVQAAHAVADAFAFVRSGAAMVSDEEKARRLAICRECPNLVDDRCLMCGCSMPYRTRAAAFHCPLPEPKW